MTVRGCLAEHFNQLWQSGRCFIAARFKLDTLKSTRVCSLDLIHAQKKVINSSNQLRFPPVYLDMIYAWLSLVLGYVTSYTIEGIDWFLWLSMVTCIDSNEQRPFYSLLKQYIKTQRLEYQILLYRKDSEWNFAAYWCCHPPPTLATYWSYVCYSL